MIEIVAPRGLRLQTTEGESPVTIAFDGKQLSFQPSTSALFQYLIDHPAARAADFLQHFEGDFERDQLLEFLSDLAEHGVIVPRPDPELPGLFRP